MQVAVSFIPLRGPAVREFGQLKREPCSSLLHSASISEVVLNTVLKAAGDRVDSVSKTCDASELGLSSLSLLFTRFTRCYSRIDLRSDFLCSMKLIVPT